MASLEKRISKMTYAATARCLCGAGMAYDETCVEEPFKIPSYWDCSAILLGYADTKVKHEARLPFTFYEIKSDSQPSANGATTRPSGSELEAIKEQLNG